VDAWKHASAFFLLAFPALLSILNPLGGAFLFLAATRGLPAPLREQLARWVAIHSFVLLTASLYVGAYVLQFFGISMPVLRVAGGIVIALSAWRLLNEGEAGDGAEQALPPRPSDASRMAFFPLTMPITAGPGTISVAIALGTQRGTGVDDLAVFAVAATATTLLICAIVYVAYRSSEGLSRIVGPTGTAISVRLSAFLLFCIGVQVFWNGAAELIAGLPAR
jgi:multiple antibiotic resistance protein